MVTGTIETSSLSQQATPPGMKNYGPLLQPLYSQVQLQMEQTRHHLEQTYVLVLGEFISTLA